MDRPALRTKRGPVCCAPSTSIVHSMTGSTRFVTNPLSTCLRHFHCPPLPRIGTLVAVRSRLSVGELTMSPFFRRLALAIPFLGVMASSLLAVPVPSAGSATITDRKGFIPFRKHVPLPGKIIGILAFDAQPVLGLE